MSFFFFFFLVSLYNFATISEHTVLLTKNVDLFRAASPFVKALCVS